MSNITRKIDKFRRLLQAIKTFLKFSLSREIPVRNEHIESNPIDSFFPDFEQLDAPEKQYIQAHFKRWLDTIELGCDFFDPIDSNTKVLSLASDGKFELMAKKKYPNFNYESSHWDLRHRFPLADSSFDGVTCLEVLEHLKDPDSIELDYISTHYLLGFFNTLTEVNRILKTGGTAIFTTPNTSSYSSLTSVLKGESHFFYWPHVREYAPFELNYYLQKCGFEVLLITSFSPYAETVKQSRYEKGLLEAAACLFNASPMMNQLRGSTLFFLVRKISDPDNILMDSGFRLITRELINEKCK